MPTSDPLRAFNRLCARLLPADDRRLTPQEYDRIVDALLDVIEQRPDWLAALSDDDRAVVLDVLSVGLAAFELAIQQRPSLLEFYSEAHLQLLVRVSSPQVRWHAQRRLDAIRESRAH
jgi:hypothetical protein